jgi:hypothetical protein
MSRAFRGILAISALAIAMPAVLPATVIYTNFAASSPLYDTVNGNLVANFGLGSDFGQGETFTPGVNATLTLLRLGLGCNFANPNGSPTCTSADSYVITLSSDAGNQPGTTIESFLIAGDSLSLFGANLVPVVLTSVLNPTLTAGKQYWVTATTTSANGIGWNLNTTGDAADQALSVDGGANWFVPSGATPGAFEVDGNASGSVPEPGTTLLLSGGLLTGLILKLRRRS